MPEPRVTFKATFHGADTQPVATARQTDTLASVTPMTGYVTKVVYLTASNPGWEMALAQLFDVGGGGVGSASRRRAFNCECHPFEFTAGSNPDLDDIDALAAIFDKNYVWVRIEAGSRAYPTSVLDVHPILLMEWSPSTNKPAGTQGLSLGIQLAYPV